MSEKDNILKDIGSAEYKHGFETQVEQEFIPKGLNEDIIRLISEKKGEPQWLLDFRLKAYRKWLTMKMPAWAHLDIPEIDFQDIIYFAAPKKATEKKEIDPELMATFDKLGIPLHERSVLAGTAVDAVFDSVSVKTTFRESLAEKGIIFCSFSEAVRDYPDLVRKYLASVVPIGDNYYAALNSAVFSDGSFCYIPKGVHCPMELSSYFELLGGLHRTHEGREPAARRSGRNRRPGQCRGQIFHRPELVSRRRAGTGRHLQLRHQEGHLQGREQQALLDPS